jgi:hypothetical protein
MSLINTALRGSLRVLDVCVCVFDALFKRKKVKLSLCLTNYALCCVVQASIHRGYHQNLYSIPHGHQFVVSHSCDTQILIISTPNCHQLNICG